MTDLPRTPSFRLVGRRALEGVLCRVAVASLHRHQTEPVLRLGPRRRVPPGPIQGVAGGGLVSEGAVGAGLHEGGRAGGGREETGAVGQGVEGLDRPELVRRIARLVQA